MSERNYTIDAEGAFLRYAGLGSDRSLRKLAAALAADEQSVPQKTLENWSTRYGWQDRIAATEAAERTQTNAEISRRLGERRLQRAQLADAMIATGGAALLATPVEQLKPVDAARLLREGLALERRILDDVSESDPTPETTLVVDLDGDDAEFFGLDADSDGDVG